MKLKLFIWKEFGLYYKVPFLCHFITILSIWQWFLQYLDISSNCQSSVVFVCFPHQSNHPVHHRANAKILTHLVFSETIHISNKIKLKNVLHVDISVMRKSSLSSLSFSLTPRWSLLGDPLAGSLRLSPAFPPTPVAHHLTGS